MSLLQPKDKHSILDEFILPAIICLVVCGTIAYFTARPSPLTTPSKPTPRNTVVAKAKPANTAPVSIHPLALEAQKKFRTEVLLQDDLTQFIIPQMPLFAQINKTLNIPASASTEEATHKLTTVKQSQTLLFHKAEQLKRRTLYLLTGDLITDFSSYTITIENNLLRVERTVNWKTENMSSKDEYIVLLTPTEKVKEALAKTSINEPEPAVRAP